MTYNEAFQHRTRSNRIATAGVILAATLGITSEASAAKAKAMPLATLEAQTEKRIPK